MASITIEVKSSSVTARKAFSGKTKDSRSRTYLKKLSKVLKQNPHEKAFIDIKHWD